MAYYPNRQQHAPNGQPQNYANSLYGSGGDFSDRTPSSQGGRSQYSQSGHTQYTSGVSESERGGTLDDSSRTPYTQGGYSQAGYSQAGYSQAGTQAGHTLNNSDSDRTPYSQGGYTQGGYTQAGYTVNNSDSDRTPYSQGGYTEGDDNLNNSGYSYAPSGYHGGSNYEGGSQSRTTGDVYSAAGSKLSSGSARRRQESSSQQYSAQFESASQCASTGGTTVAGGGRGRCPYQIEFQVQNQGKQISATKRIIYFRFGFANEDAMSEGRTGTDCRGQEHDIVITWSITGGKRSISMNGREIQYSAGKRANASRRADMLDASWRMSDHIYELRCYAYKPAAGSPEKRDPRWKQYALVIDGRGFFELPKIFDLGLKGLRPAPMINAPPQQVFSNASTSMSGITNTHASDQPSKQVKSAIQSRIDEQRKLMKARTKAVSKEKSQNRSDHEKEKGVKSLNSDLESMGLESTGLESTGLESTGLESAVFSSAPSELSEARNRQEAAPARAAQPKVPVPALPPSHSTNEERLTAYTGKHANRAGRDLGPPKIRQQQMQSAPWAAQNRNQQNAPAKQPPRPHQYQIQAQQKHSQHNTHTKQQKSQYAPANQPALQDPQIQNSQSTRVEHQQSKTPRPNYAQPQTQHQIEAQHHQNQQKPHMQRSQPQNFQADSPSPQQNQLNVQRSSMVFEPQQPPTYEEITRDILGAYDGPSISERTATESSIVSRPRDASDGYSELGSLAEDSSVGFSIAERSIVSRDSTVVTTTRYPKPPVKSPYSFAKSQASSSVDTRGVNKWAYF